VFSASVNLILYFYLFFKMSIEIESAECVILVINMRTHFLNLNLLIEICLQCHSSHTTISERIKSVEITPNPSSNFYYITIMHKFMFLF
jgi:hypothetical protein